MKCQMSSYSFLVQSQQLPHARNVRHIQESDGHSEDIAPFRKLQTRRASTSIKCKWLLSVVSEAILLQRWAFAAVT